MLANPQASVGVHTPAKLYPELVFLPHFARVGLVGELHLLAGAAQRLAQYRLTESDPYAGVCLVGIEVMAFTGQAHGQDVVGKIGRLVPGGRQGDVHAEFIFVAQRFNPAEAVRVGPNRIEHPREVHVHLAAVFLQHVRQQEAHLEEGQRIFVGKMQLVPELLGRRLIKEFGVEFVPGVGRSATRRTHATGQYVEKMEGTRDSPATEVTGRSAAPVMRCKARTGLADQPRYFNDHIRFHTTLLLGKLRGILNVLLPHGLDEVLKGFFPARMPGLQVFVPVDPVLQIVTVIQAFIQNDFGHSEQYGSLGARIARHPVVRHTGCVGQARVHGAQFGAFHFTFYNALGVRVEVVPGLQVSRDQEDKFSVGVVG